jgi:hypothetical protein
MISRRSIFSMIAGLVAWAAGTRTAHTALKGWNPKGVISFDPYDIIRLARCNAMGRYSPEGGWIPFRYTLDGEWLTIGGVKAEWPPWGYRFLATEDIIAEMMAEYTPYDPYDVIRTGRCNVMGRSVFEDTSPWMPYRMKGREFFTCTGLKAVPPPIYRSLSVDEIIAEMKARGDVPISFALNSMPHP